MSTAPYKDTVFNDFTTTDKHAASAFSKRLFFVTGVPGCGKSTFLAALVKKYGIRPSGFITKKEGAAVEPALYIHPVINGSTIYRCTTGNRVGICRAPVPVGFAEVFDTCGVMCLTQAEEAVKKLLDGGHTSATLNSFGSDCARSNCHTSMPEITATTGLTEIAQSSGIGCTKMLSQSSILPVILMDELGVMEAEAALFFRAVCALFFNTQYYIIGAVKPHGTRFLPILEQMPEAVVFQLRLQNRTELYAQLEQAQSLPAFLHALG